MRMTLRAIGAGLGRTGTNSLKLALERLLGAACYHTHEVVLHLDHVQMWQHAFDTGDGDWDAIFAGYTAGVDWPVCRFWRRLAAHYPDAVIILSTRSSAEEWWASAEHTVFASMQRGPLPGLEQWHRMMEAAMQPFTGHWDDRDAAIAGYERHNHAVRAGLPADRVVEWRPDQGWAPLCAALGIDPPEEPFPHVNTTREFRELAALDG
jgi:hypothetical protein